MKIILLITLLSSCALQRSVEVDNPVKIKTRHERILVCVDKYIGEGLKRAYDICKDLYTLE